MCGLEDADGRGDVRKILQRYLELLRGRDKGTVAVTFLLSLPLLLILIGIFAQYALLVNGRLTVDRAVSSAGRSAMTALPTYEPVDDIDGEATVNKAARLALVPISPVAQDGASS